MKDVLIFKSFQSINKSLIYYQNICIDLSHLEVNTITRLSLLKCGGIFFASILRDRENWCGEDDGGASRQGATSPRIWQWLKVCGDLVLSLRAQCWRYFISWFSTSFFKTQMQLPDARNCQCVDIIEVAQHMWFLFCGIVVLHLYVLTKDPCLTKRVCSIHSGNLQESLFLRANFTLLPNRVLHWGLLCLLTCGFFQGTQLGQHVSWAGKHKDSV